MSSDEAIKKEVVEALCRDPRTDAACITVEVSDGNVVLEGTAAGSEMASAAGEDAMGVPGVCGVTNLIEIQIPGTGPVPDATAMKTRVQALLSADPRIGAAEIRVSVARGLVTLTGTVDALWKKFHAEDLVIRQPGIAGIRNNLSVMSFRTALDRRIAEDIAVALKRKRLIHQQGIAIGVEDGTVNLTGVVPDTVVRRRVDETVFAIPGVVRVRDNMMLSDASGEPSEDLGEGLRNEAEL